MALSDMELRLAMAWRVHEISDFQRFIEDSHYASGLDKRERLSVRRFASDEICKLNLATEEEIVGYYRSYLAAVGEVVRMALSQEEKVG